MCWFCCCGCLELEKYTFHSFGSGISVYSARCGGGGGGTITKNRKVERIEIIISKINRRQHRFYRYRIVVFVDSLVIIRIKNNCVYVCVHKCAFEGRVVLIVIVVAILI